MVNDEVSVRDILAEEGLGQFAFQLETLHRDLESANLTDLLAMVIRETQRLSNWYHQSSDHVSAARECYSLAIEAVEKLTPGLEQNYRISLIFGYLYGQHSSGQASVPQECYASVFESSEGLPAREDQNYRRLFSVGYQYGRLIKPGRGTIHRGAIARVKAMKADMKRSEGGQATAEIKKSQAASRKADAKKLWDEFIAAGRPERGLAQVVAFRIGVTDKTIREWRRSGWK
jgi:hypothetical protein